METIENGFAGWVHDLSTSIQFVNRGYCFQGHLRPAKMTQNGSLDCEAIYLLYYWLLPL